MIIKLAKKATEKHINDAITRQTENRFFKLNNDFKKYGLEMKFFGYVPTICEIETTTTAIDRFFYE